MNRGNARYRSGIKLGTAMRSRWNGLRNSLLASLTDFSRCGFLLSSPNGIISDALTLPICITYVACILAGSLHPRPQLEDRRGRDHSPPCYHCRHRASVRRRVDANFTNRPPATADANAARIPCPSLLDLFVVAIYYDLHRYVVTGNNARL